MIPIPEKIKDSRILVKLSSAGTGHKIKHALDTAGFANVRTFARKDIEATLKDPPECLLVVCSGKDPDGFLHLQRRISSVRHEREVATVLVSTESCGIKIRVDPWDMVYPSEATLSEIIGGVSDLLSLHLARREHRESQLAKSEEESIADVYAALSAMGVPAVIIKASSGLIEWASLEAYELLKYQSPELKGVSVDQLVPDEVRGKHVFHRRSFVQDPRVRSMGSISYLKAVRRDRTLIPVDISLSPIGEHVIAILRLREFEELG